MLNGAEIIIVLVLIAVVVGPQRLPEYAEQLARLVRTLRDMARGATQTIKDELGPEAADLDFSKLDPRQYDPRRIVRDALMEDLSPTSKSAGSRSGSSAKSAGSSATAAAAGAAAAGSTTTASPGEDAAPEEAEEDPLAHGAPFDDEAT